MSTQRSLISVLFLVLLFSLTLVSANAAGRADEWKPIDPQHLGLKASTVEKDADAEVLFWEVYVEKSFEGAELRHYVRIKIFNDRGRDSQGKVELPFVNGNKILDVAARTIKADGTIINLGPEAVFETTLIKFGKFKVRAKTFALPSVEAGVIVEYRWREVVKDSFYQRLQFQRDIPAREISYTIKQKDNNYVWLRMKPFNMKDAVSSNDGKGLYTIKMSNVPAFRAEPNMPPENEVRAWMLVYYTGIGEYGLWAKIGQNTYEAYKGQLKPNDELRNAAAAAIGDATTDEQKIERLYDFCRLKIKNIEHDPSFTEDVLAKLKENKNPTDTLRRGSGSGEEIDVLFAALAVAAGFEARVTKTSDRSDVFFDRNFTSGYFLSGYNIAVRVNSKWRLYDPATTYLPAGMLRWQEEGVEALVSDPINPQWAHAQISEPEKSKKIRKAHLKLGEDGTLEGDVSIEYTGHAGAEQKEFFGSMSSAELEKQTRESVKEWLGAGEISDIRIENLNEPIKPLVKSYRVRISDYAQRTGRRLFFQPGFFQYNGKARFPTQERKYPIYFNYAWMEEDDVTIELPTGFELENATEPVPINAEGISAYEVRIRVDGTNRKLSYKRSFFFGRSGALMFPGIGYQNQLPTVYPQLKRLFDLIHERDSQTLALKQSPLAAK